MRKLLLLLLFPVVLFGADANLQYNTGTHLVKKPPTSVNAPHDLDFTGLDVFGLSVTGGGGGTPGGSDRMLQFNNAFTFGGVPYATFDGTAVTFRSGARFILADPTDATKRVQIALANPTATLKTLTISDNSVSVIPTSVTPNQFVTNVNTLGVVVTAQPLFSNLGGTLSLAQTSMSSGKLLGRYSAATGAIQEITPDGVTVFLDSGTGVLSAAGGGGGTPGGSDTQFQFNNASAFGGSSSLIFSSGSIKATANSFLFTDFVDPTKRMQFILTNVPTGTTEQVIVPNTPNPVLVKSDTGAASNFLTAISATGIISKAQPSFTDIAGTLGLAQQNFPINLERFVDSINGSDITGAANLAKPFLTIAGACSGAPSGTVIYAYPNLTGYDQGTTPLVIPAGVTIAGAGPNTVITGAVTGVTRAVVEPSTSSAVYNLTIQNTSSTGIAFGVGSSSTPFTSAYVGGCKIIANAYPIYINKAGTTGLVIENTTAASQNVCLFQNVSTATTETRNCDFISDGTTNAVESKGLNITNGTIRFNYGSITVGNSTGTNVGAFGSGATSTVELHGVRILNSGGGSTNYDVQSQSSAVVGVAGVFRSDAAALTTNGTVTELSRYAVRDNNLSDFPNIGSGTRGDLIVRNATGWVRFAAGLDGNVLTTHGSTADPTWTAVTGAGGIVDDAVFGPGWNGSTVTAPSQNAVYDYLHLIAPGDDGKVNLLNQTGGITRTDSTGTIQTPLAAPTGAIVGTSDTQTLTNKRITKRRLSTAVPGPTPAINTDNYDVVHFTGMNADITVDSTTLSGTPLPADTLRFDFTDDGTSRAITFDSLKFAASPGQALPTSTTAGVRLDVGFVWDSVANRWRCLASSNPVAVSGAGTVTSVGLTATNGITVSGATPITSSGSWALGLPFTLAGTAGKTFTLSNSLTLAGTDGSTLNIGAGGTLGSNAFTSTAFLTAANISDSVFSVTWNGDTTTAPSRNAIYDEVHGIDPNNNAAAGHLDQTTAGLVKVGATGLVASGGAIGGTDYADLAFRTIAVSGQSNVVADTASDTLTLVAGSGMTITTTAGTDTITLASAGGGGSGTVTSVDILGTTNQVTVTGTSPITTAGSLTLSIPASAQLDVAKLTNLTTNGFVKTGSADGTLSIDTSTYLTTASAASTYQPLDSDLTTIAGLTATTDNFMVAASSAWASRTPAQARTSLGLVIGTNVEAWDADLDTWATLTPSANFQTMVPHTFSQMRTDLSLVPGTNVEAWDADLDTLAGLTATTDNFIVSVSSAWASRTPAQVRTTLGLVIGTNVQAWDADLDTWATKTAPSGTAVGDTDTQTLTNKRVNPRVTTITSNATWSPSADTDDEYNITAQAAAVTTISNPSGTPVEGQKLIIRVKDDGTARAISGWGANYRFSSDLPAPTTTVLGKGLWMGFIYTTAGGVTKWDNVSQLGNF